MNINGHEVEFDIYELSNAEKYEIEMNKILNITDKVMKLETLKERIELQCTAIFDFFDALLGDGTHKKFFGESTNLRTCMDFYAKFILAMKEEDKSFVSELETLTSDITQKGKLQK